MVPDPVRQEQSYKTPGCFRFVKGKALAGLHKRYSINIFADQFVKYFVPTVQIPSERLILFIPLRYNKLFNASLSYRRKPPSVAGLRHLHTTVHYRKE